MKVPLCAFGSNPRAGMPSLGARCSCFGSTVCPKAVFNFCMHLGGPMRRDGERLVCEWHGAEFECGRGTGLKGQAPKDSRLITLPIRAEDGVLNYIYGE